MKNRQIKWLLAVVAVVVLVGFAIRELIAKMPCGVRPRAGMVEASNLYKWINAWSCDHDGRLPVKLDALRYAGIGVPDNFENYLERVIEYRGGGQRLADLSKEFVILRCRAGNNSEMEARVFADGHAEAFARE